MVWLFLTSGLFLGWSLGANDAANIFGTAVGTRMLRFRTAALVAGIFVILGAVISGAGAAHTLGKLGSINALGGAFTVALAAAVTVAWMTRAGLPVSTTQAIVGAIVGWDIFSGMEIDTVALTKIVSTWVFSPVLAALFAFLLFKMLRFILCRAKIHLLAVDNYTRIGLLLIGAFGAYSLGANNIANVMGVFVSSNPFKGLSLGFFHLNDTQVLFMVGGIAIAVGIWTYSYRVMKTVGNELYKLSPLSALVVVLAESLVLFIFASQGLERFLLKIGLPPIPLVPVSSSQAVVGGVIGIGIARGGGRAINYRMLLRIVWGWIITPLSSGIMAFISLFFIQNVFQVKVYKPVAYCITEEVVQKAGVSEIKEIESLKDKFFYNSQKLTKELRKAGLDVNKVSELVKLSRIDSIYIDSTVATKELDPNWFGNRRIKAVKKLHGRLFLHKWEVVDALSEIEKDWRFLPDTRWNRLFNRELKKMYEEIFHVFSVERVPPE